MTKYRVLVVDDSPFMRKVFSDSISSDPDFQVAGTAADGLEAVELALKLEPDVITMDLEMPVMNGLEALQKIMAARPTPILMLSAVTDNGTRDTIRALQYGAVDFIRKPDGAVNLDIRRVGEQLREKLHIAAELAASGNYRMLPAVVEPPLPPQPAAAPAPPPAAAVEPSPAPPRREPPAGQGGAAGASPAAAADLAAPRRPAPRLAGKAPPAGAPASAVRRAGSPPPPAEVRPATAFAPAAGARRAKRPPADPEPAAAAPDRAAPGRTAFQQLVAIGTSTGGPRALHEVLTGIPADFPAPILIVQHMPPKFTNSLAQRLDSFAQIRVCEAQDGEPVRSGTAYIAPGGRHMGLARAGAGEYRIALSDGEPQSGHKPSVDRLFESLIGFKELKRYAVLMTGMGSDGAKGMKSLLDDGAETTIAEAEETCIVYGMPRSAVELGAARQVVRLQQIARALVHEVSVRKR